MRTASSGWRRRPGRSASGVGVATVCRSISPESPQRGCSRTCRWSPPGRVVVLAHGTDAAVPTLISPVVNSGDQVEHLVVPCMQDDAGHRSRTALGHTGAGRTPVERRRGFPVQVFLTHRAASAGTAAGIDPYQNSPFAVNLRGHCQCCARSSSKPATTTVAFASGSSAITFYRHADADTGPHRPGRDASGEVSGGHAQWLPGGRSCKPGGRQEGARGLDAGRSGVGCAACTGPRGSRSLQSQTGADALHTPSALHTLVARVRSRNRGRRPPHENNQ